MNLGERLRDIRREVGLTQVELAQKSHTSQSVISMIERGERPHSGADTVARIEDALGIPRGALSDEIEPHPTLTEFLNSQVAKDLNVTPEECRILRYVRWYSSSAGEEPTVHSWSMLLQARRALRRNKSAL